MAKLKTKVKVHYAERILTGGGSGHLFPAESRPSGEWRRCQAEEAAKRQALDGKNEPRPEAGRAAACYGSGSIVRKSQNRLDQDQTQHRNF